jgi:hypothetical protein
MLYQDIIPEGFPGFPDGQVTILLMQSGTIYKGFINRTTLDQVIVLLMIYQTTLKVVRLWIYYSLVIVRSGNRTTLSIYAIGSTFVDR